MAIQRFPLASLQKVRRYIQQTLILPDVEQQPKSVQSSDELPEPESLDELSGLFSFGGSSAMQTFSTVVQDQWFISTVNPGACLLKLPGLKLMPDYRLVSYLYRHENSGVGIVWAVPEELSTTAQLERALVNSKSITQIPRPEGAMAHFMEALEGDRSPVSFVIASIVRRELQEFGATGDRRNWGLHTLIDQVDPQHWQWRVDQPQDLSPKVRVLPDGRAAVEFFTYRAGTPKTLYRHLDQYPLGVYKAATLDKALAIAQP